MGAVGLAWANLYAGPDTRTQAGEWIAKNIPAGATIGLMDVPWQFDTPPLDEKRYQIAVLKPERTALDESGPEWVIFSEYQTPPLALRGSFSPSEQRFWDRIRGIDGGEDHEPFHNAKWYGIWQSFEAKAGLRHNMRWVVVPASCWPIHDLRYPNPTIRVAKRHRGVIICY